MCASVVVMCTVYMEVQMHNLYIALKAKWYGWHNWSKFCLLNYIFKVL